MYSFRFTHSIRCPHLYALFTLSVQYAAPANSERGPLYPLSWTKPRMTNLIDTSHTCQIRDLCSGRPCPYDLPMTQINWTTEKRDLLNIATEWAYRPMEHWLIYTYIINILIASRAGLLRHFESYYLYKPTQWMLMLSTACNQQPRNNSIELELFFELNPENRWNHSPRPLNLEINNPQPSNSTYAEPL